MTRIIIALLLLALPATGLAGSVLVLADGTGDYPTIRAAINAVSYGDTVLVGPGVYTGIDNRAIVVQSKVLLSTDGYENTVIDCEQKAHALTLWTHGETPTVVDGLSIVHGLGGVYVGNVYQAIVRNCYFEENASNYGEGGALRDEGIGDLRISNCTFRRNSAVTGGAIWSGTGTSSGIPLVIENSSFFENVAFYGGGGAMYCYRRILQVTGSDVRGNISEYGGGAIRGEVGSVVLSNSVLAGNYTLGKGGALLVHRESTLSMSGCTVAGNYAVGGGGGLALESCADTTVSITRCILAGNCSNLGADLLTFDSTPQVEMECCALGEDGVFGYGSVTYLGAQVYVDPVFCNPIDCSLAPSIAGDYSLSIDSPCAPDNSPCGILIGALGVGCGEPSGTDGGEANPIMVLTSPNPCRGSFDIRLAIPLEERGSVEVFDPQGRQVTSIEMSHGKSSARVDLKTAPDGDLPAGVYLVRLRSGGQVGTTKAVVVR